MLKHLFFYLTVKDLVNNRLPKNEQILFRLSHPINFFSYYLIRQIILTFFDMIITVIIMRIFYIYNVNDLYASVYDKYPYKLYKMLEEAYFTNKHNLVESSCLYEQMTTRFNKLFMNNYLFANNKLDVYYCKKNNIHFISSRHEYSKLMVSSYCLKLKTNLNYPKFFEHIHGYSDNIFVCDFQNQDYFWLNKVIKVEERIDKEQDFVVKYP